MKLLVINPDIFEFATEKTVALVNIISLFINRRTKLTILLTKMPDERCLKLLGSYLDNRPAVKAFINAYELLHHPSSSPVEYRIDLINRRWPGINVDWMSIDVSDQLYDVRSLARVIAVHNGKFDQQSAVFKLRSWMKEAEVPFKFRRNDYYDPEKDDWAAIERSGILSICLSSDPDSESMMRYVCERLHRECTEFVDEPVHLVINDKKIPKIFTKKLDDYKNKYKIIDPMSFDEFCEFLYESLHGKKMSKPLADIVHPRLLNL